MLDHVPTTARHHRAGPGPDSDPGPDLDHWVTPERSGPPRRRTRAAGRPAVRRGLTALVGAVLAVTCALPAAAAQTPTGRAHGDDHHTTQQAMDEVVAAGVPGMVARSSGARGTWAGHSGVADLHTGAPRQADERYRVGSITKTFIATVVLQLEGEGRLDLDDTVDHWLPGVVSGNGHDGTRIKLRQLLNHTSGIYSYTDDPEFMRLEFSTDFLQHRYDTWTPERIAALAMSHPPYFDPGAGWHYSDTNYVLAGMIIERVTGRPYAREVERRILRPLHLDATTLPGTSATMPQPSARAYSQLTGKLGGQGAPGSPVYDVTSFNPSPADAAGEAISTAGDLNKFYRALLSGRLLKPEQLTEMTTTVSISPGSPYSYGLGLMKQQTSCGALWGHSGSIQGSISHTRATAHGEHALSFNVNSDWLGSYDQIFEAEFCGK
ncbi:serine hydrolase domain-containing protein [Streptomyces sp. HSW2009]|uniref:serine hydrolase domain-containing protein n=1 Tax=Streptomyces sp. HSW2009 TaxID=3142890 RepID=UPI0032F04506